MTLAECLSQMREGLDLQQAGREIQGYMHSRIIAQFQKARKGGNERGVQWEPFKNPWYTRSDGSEVPIWGGVKWMNNPKRKVKGRLRSKNPEGKKRYTQGSALMQSTGMLKAAMIADTRISRAGIEMHTPIKYAVYQDALRPFMYFTEDEAVTCVSFLARRINA